MLTECNMLSQYNASWDMWRASEGKFATVYAILFMATIRLFPPEELETNCCPVVFSMLPPLDYRGKTTWKKHDAVECFSPDHSVVADGTFVMALQETLQRLQVTPDGPILLEQLDNLKDEPQQMLEASAASASDFWEALPHAAHDQGLQADWYMAQYNEPHVPDRTVLGARLDAEPQAGRGLGQLLQRVVVVAAVDEPIPQQEQPAQEAPLGDKPLHHDDPPARNARQLGQ